MYLITLSPMKVAKENQRQLEKFLQSEGAESVLQIFVSSAVNIHWSGILFQHGHDLIIDKTQNMAMAELNITMYPDFFGGIAIIDHN